MPARVASSPTRPENLIVPLALASERRDDVKGAGDGAMGAVATDAAGVGAAALGAGGAAVGPDLLIQKWAMNARASRVAMMGKIHRLRPAVSSPRPALPMGAAATVSTRRNMLPVWGPAPRKVATAGGAVVGMTPPGVSRPTSFGAR